MKNITAVERLNCCFLLKIYEATIEENKRLKETLKLESERLKVVEKKYSDHMKECSQKPQQVPVCRKRVEKVELHCFEEPSLYSDDEV